MPNFSATLSKCVSGKQYRSNIIQSWMWWCQDQRKNLLQFFHILTSASTTWGKFSDSLLKPGTLYILHHPTAEWNTKRCTRYVRRFHPSPLYSVFSSYTKILLFSFLPIVSRVALTFVIFFVCVVKLLQSPLNGVRKVGLLELEQKMRLAHSISCCLIAL